VNISEANDVISLLRWLTHPAGHSAEKAKAAAVRLADRSRARLMTGIGGEEVAANWPKRLGGDA
jgi:hypothetical protein